MGAILGSIVFRIQYSRGFDFEKLSNRLAVAVRDYSRSYQIVRREIRYVGSQSDRASQDDKSNPCATHLNSGDDRETNSLLT